MNLRTLLSAICLVLLSAQAAIFGAEPAKGTPPNPFFALCIGTHDAKKRTPAQQAEMLKELGYAGMGHLWCKGLPERLKTLDAAGLKLFQVYIRVNVDPKKQAYDPALKTALPLLKGRGVILGVLMSGGKPSDTKGDARAVTVLREMADLAGPAGVKLALYPHTSDWLERVEDGLRVAEKVDRENVGVMFNLCHWLKVTGGGDPAPVLKQAGRRLFAVTINGADKPSDGAKGWDRLIQPLDRGTFDVAGLLKTLKAMDYRGPIGLQCYGLGGDAKLHLARSIQAWRALQKRAR